MFDSRATHIFSPWNTDQSFPGCNPSRLKDFIVDFYANNALQSQNTDDAFCGFVWSLVVQRPTVRVGTVPPGLTSEVWIAPQASAKRKALLNGEEIVPEAPPKLDIVPDAKSKSLQDLEKQYGDRLRIALDPDAIYATITGSHIRVCPARSHRWSLSNFA